MEDVRPWLSRTILAHTALGAVLNLADSVRHRGARRTGVFFALATGLPAVGEWLATGPLDLLRHRTRPRTAGVPVAVLLGWYCVIRGSFVVAGRLLGRLPLDEAGRRGVSPPVVALVGASLDLIVDPAGLDAGLWEWKADGAYASDVKGPNGRKGVPVINYLGWISLVAGVATIYGKAFERGFGEDLEDRRLPALLLLPYYLAAVAWAVRRRGWRYLVYSSPFPVALYAALRKR